GTGGLSEAHTIGGVVIDTRLGPDVTVTAPKASAVVQGPVALSASVVDVVAVRSVQFYVDGRAVGSADTSAPYSVTWNSRTVANGAHTVTARAVDVSGITVTSSAISIRTNNDLTKPTVTVTAPASGATVRGIITLRASASDNVRTSTVRFFVDGRAY